MTGASDGRRASRPVTGDQLHAAVQDTIATQIRPLLRVHGGDCELIDVEGGVVRIRFLMACTACKLRPLTLLAAVRPRLLCVDGVVDVHAAGVGVSAAAVRRADQTLGRNRDALAERRPDVHSRTEQRRGHAEQLPDASGRRSPDHVRARARRM